MKTQMEKAAGFRELHQGTKAFVIPNPWDLGSARLLAGLGFEALATSSAGAAFAMGMRDGALGREAMMEHIAAVAAATDLPVSADLENGFGDAPEFAAETIRMAAEAGACGGSIEDARGEDATARTDEPIYARELAVERVRAAVEAAKSLAFPFTLTARCENFLHGRNDLADTIARLQAYQEAGADVLYAPGITTREQIESLVPSVDRPVNVLVGLKGMDLTVAQATELGVRRLSVGSGLARAAYGTLLRAAREISEHGTFNFGDDVSGLSELCRLFPT